MPIFADFLDFENGCCYLNTIARKRRKAHGFLAFLLKNRHYFIGSKTSLSYIRVVIGEKLCSNVPIFADFLDFENVCCYLNTIARKRGKTHGFLAFLLKVIHYFIGLNTS